MSMSISGIRPPLPATESIRPRGSAAPKGGFEAALETAIDQVEQSRHQANATIQRVLSGESDELHTTILETQKADLQFELFLQVRNKVVSAYQEIMKMQV